MKPSDVLFQRAIVISVVVFAVVGAVYFRLVGPRAWAVIVLFLPMIGAASAAAPFVFDLPVAAKALFWILGFGILLLGLLGLILTRRTMSYFKASKRRRADEPAVAADDRRPGTVDG